MEAIRDLVLEAQKGMTAWRNPAVQDKYFRDFVLDLQTEAVPLLEESRNKFRLTGEEGLTVALTLPLRAAYNLTTESNANGHVDIFLKYPFPGISWKGEAKLINNFPWYVEGMETVVEKYNSGGERQTLMIGFCKKPDMYKIQKDFKQKIDAQKPARFHSWTNRTATPFVSAHSSNGAPIDVHHVWVNCLYEPNAKMKARIRGRAKKPTNRRPSVKNRTKRKASKANT